MPAVHGSLAGIICGVIIIRCDYLIQHTRNYFGSIVFVWNQAIWQLPMEFPAAAALQSADLDSPLHSALRTHEPDAGIPVGKRRSADETLGYDAAPEPFLFLYSDDSIQGNSEICKQNRILQG